MKLRGRPEAPNQAPWAHNVSRARGADTQAAHGPLQRLLGGRTLQPPTHEFPQVRPKLFSVLKELQICLIASEKTLKIESDALLQI